MVDVRKHVLGFLKGIGFSGVWLSPYHNLKIIDLFLGYIRASGKLGGIEDS